MMRTAATLITWLAVVGALASEPQQPLVRAQLKPDTVSVGEVASLTVTVLVPTWFPRAPEYPAFELSSLVTRLPPNSSHPTTERVNGESWSGIVRNYQLYPLIGATYVLDGQVIRINYADPDDPGNALHFDVAVPTVELRAEVPAGAEALDPYLAGRSLQLSREIDGKLEGLHQGDALVLHYAAELEGLSALFLPPLAPALQQNGVSVYADQPVIDDAAPARRSEKVTLVFQGGGEFTLPGVQLQWWNTQTGQVETAIIEPLAFSVEGKPPSLRERVAGLDWAVLARVALLLGVLLYLLRRWGPLVRQRLRARVDAYRHSEPCAFRALRRELKRRDAHVAHHALLAWLPKLDPDADLRSFAVGFGDAALQESVEALSASLYAGATAQVDYAALYHRLAAARRRYHSSRASTGRQLLPPLNP